MNKTQDKAEQRRVGTERSFRHPIHPFFTSNSSEETLRRVKEFPERAAKFLEKWRADREKDPG